MNDDRNDEMLTQLTLSEKCAMVSGESLWTVPGCERLGIPSWTVSDGPVGVRGHGDQPGTVLPSPTAMAATWDVALVERLGVVLGQECLARDVDMLLAPNVNMQRVPGGGRLFEMFSEDPELAARMTVAYVRGVQSQGVGACVKHYVGNEQEHNRYTIESRIGERALREVYLRPFEAAVTQAGARAVMAAYNYVNGDHACSHEDLLSRVLKKEWGFDGIVVADWGALKETLGPALRGCDVEMPGPGRWWGAGRLQSAVESGQVPEPVLDDKVRRILHFLAWRQSHAGPATPPAEQSGESLNHERLVRAAAADSMVLVKNGGLLPLPADASVAVIGPGARRTALLGGGSAILTPYRHRSAAEAFEARWPHQVLTADGVDLETSAPALPTSWIDGGMVQAELFEGSGFATRPFDVQMTPSVSNRWFGDSYPANVERMSVRLTFRMRPNESGRHRLVVTGYGGMRLYLDGQLTANNRTNSFATSLGRRGADAEVELRDDRTYDVVIEAEPKLGGVALILTELGVERIEEGGRERELLHAEQVARETDVAVVIVGSNEQWESEGEDRISLALPAGQDELVRRVVTANPRTVVVLNCGGPMLMPWLDAVPAVLIAWYPGQEGADALFDVLTGEADPGGRMPTTWPRQEADTPAHRYPGDEESVSYDEGLLLGYRWYDAEGIAPLVAFGHGGSYTSFEWGQPQVSGSRTDIAVEVPVRNTGTRAGSEVVQVYVAPVDPQVADPRKVLAGFAKLVVAPGETQTATIHLTERAFARWDEATHGWVCDPSRHEIVVAASAVDERFRLSYPLPA